MSVSCASPAFDNISNGDRRRMDHRDTYCCEDECPARGGHMCSRPSSTRPRTRPQFMAEVYGSRIGLAPPPNPWPDNRLPGGGAQMSDGYLSPARLYSRRPVHAPTSRESDLRLPTRRSEWPGRPVVAPIKPLLHPQVSAAVQYRPAVSAQWATLAVAEIIVTIHHVGHGSM